MKKKVFFILFLMFFAICNNLAAERILSNYNHAGSVLDMAAKENVFFSSGEDGFVIQHQKNSIEAYQFSDIPIKNIVLNPVNDDIAIYETDSMISFRLSVIDWKTKRTRFVKRFTDKVSFLGYSAKGSYLLVGTSTAKGFMILDSITGEIESLDVFASGIVKYAKTNDSESTLILYASNGDLVYFDLNNRSKKASFSLESNLSNLNLFDKNRIFSGTKNNKLYQYKASNGKLISKTDLKNPVFIKDKSDKTSFLKKDSSGYAICEIENNLLNEKSFVEFTENVTSCLKLNGKYIIASDKGNIFYYENNSSLKKENFSSHFEYEKIMDICINGDFCYALTDNAIYKVCIAIEDIEQKLVFIAENPGYNRIDVLNENIILWEKGSGKAVVAVLPNGIITKIYSPKDKIAKLRVMNSNSICILDGFEYFVKLNILGEKLSEIKNINIFDFSYVDGDNLVFSNVFNSKKNTPITCVSLRTTEKFYPDIEDAEEVFSLDTVDGYCIGFMKKNIHGNISTEFFKYDLDGKEYIPLLTLPDENRNALVSVSDEMIYTTLDSSCIVCFNRNMKLEDSFVLPRSVTLAKKLVSDKNTLIILNEDGTVTAYDYPSGYYLGDWFIKNNTANLF